MVESSLVTLLRMAGGLTAFRELPVPRLWDSSKRPHVALIEAARGKVFSFFISQHSNGGLSVIDVEHAPDGTIVEVKHSANDYRYYRRDRHMWRMVAEVRDHFFIEVYEHAEAPVTIPLPCNHIMASD